MTVPYTLPYEDDAPYWPPPKGGKVDVEYSYPKLLGVTGGLLGGMKYTIPYDKNAPPRQARLFADEMPPEHWAYRIEFRPASGDPVHLVFMNKPMPNGGLFRTRDRAQRCLDRYRSGATSPEWRVAATHIGQMWASLVQKRWDARKAVRHQQARVRRIQEAARQEAVFNDRVWRRNQRLQKDEVGSSWTYEDSDDGVNKPIIWNAEPEGGYPAGPFVPGKVIVLPKPVPIMPLFWGGSPGTPYEYANMKAAKAAMTDAWELYAQTLNNPYGIQKASQKMTQDSGGSSL